MWQSQRVDSYTSGSSTVFVVSQFVGSTNCGASAYYYMGMAYYTANRCVS